MQVFLALGSNLGDRQGFLDDALRRLGARPDFSIRTCSAYYETAPVGGPADAGAYLNAVAEADTPLSPEAVLAWLLEVERQLGRYRTTPNAPRTVDLDLLLYGDLVRINSDPLIPHPRLHERHFVLKPLSEIAPQVVHPVLGKSIRELERALPVDDQPPRVHSRPQPKRTRELSGLRALVTGSTSGIGRAIALELAAAGAHVIVHGRRSAEAAEAVARQCGGESTFRMADLASPADCDRLARDAWDHWGGIDIVVQNAGVDLLTGDAPGWSFDRKWDALNAVDIAATMRLCRDFGTRMTARGSGCILTMGWDQAETGMEGDSGQLFGAAKGAVMAFSKALAVTLAPMVRVNCICPGWIKTAWGESTSPAWNDRVLRETPLKRWGTPEDVARVARWLASPDAAYITGQCIPVNGGAVRS
jgi:3-oxoacyl-[acyl-carrier protein] reductase